MLRIFLSCYMLVELRDRLMHPERQFPKIPALVLATVPPLGAILINPFQIRSICVKRFCQSGLPERQW
jgi:hypothetical protein